MGKVIKEIERKFIQLEPLEFGEMVELFNKHKSYYVYDCIKLYIDIVLTTKPQGFDSYYAKILKESLYDRKAKFFTIQFKTYISELFEIIVDELYNSDESYLVIKHIDSGRFARLDASYTSYDGVGFFGSYWYEVTPKEVISIEYTK